MLRGPKRASHHAALYGATLAGCLAAVACSGSKSPAAQPGLPSAGTTTGAGVGASPGGPSAAVGGSKVGSAGTGVPSGTAGISGLTAGSTAGTAVTATGGTAALAGTSAPPLGGAGGPTVTAPGDTGASVLQYHKDAKRSGMYADAAFTRAAAAMLKKDSSFTAMVTGQLYAQPLYFEGGPGGKDLVITATENNEVSAFSAADGSMVWRKMLDAPATTGLPCGNINPLGVTGTPVIDAASRTLFVAAMTTGPKHQIYALSLDDGSPRTGWPVDVSAIKAGSLAFSSAEQNQRGALIIVNGTVYVPYGGHFGDCGSYHGWVVGVPIANPSAPVAFATASVQGGIWAPGGLASDGTSVFAATGNTGASGLGSPGSWGHGEAILRLPVDLKTITESQTKDFFAAQNWSTLDAGDLDVGGSGPILFDVPGATPSSLIMALGKGGGAYLISQENLGGMGGMLDMKMVASGGITGGMIQAAASYTTPTGTFVAFRAVQSITGCGTGNGYLGALKVEGSPAKMTVAWCAGGSGTGSPIVTTTDGTAESVVWYIVNGSLFGFNGETGAAVYSGGASDGVGSTAKFQTPIVAKGRMFVAALNQVVAYKLN
jgi:hypothetical protein